MRVYVDPTVGEANLELDGDPDPAIDAQLARLIASGDILRINIWSRDGRVVYSTEPTLRGRRFSIGEDLATAFGGQSVASYEREGEVDADEPDSSRRPSLTLEIYVPIRGATDGNPFGVYEVYEDARPIEDRVSAASERGVPRRARRGEQRCSALLSLAFAGSSRLLRRQNRLLREQARRTNSS